MGRSHSTFRCVKRSLLIMQLSGLILINLQVNACAPNSYYAARQEEGNRMKFFHVVNKTGVEIKVEADADGRELFVKEMEAAVKDQVGIVHPAEEQYPTLEMKITLSNQAKKLTVRESLYLKKDTTFDISDSPAKEDAGFQIVVTKDKLIVTQDYYPAR
jgi:hypothetical protein